MQKHSSLLVASLLSFSCVYGDSDFDTRLNNLEAEVSAIEQKNVEGTMGIKNPTSQPALRNTGFFLTGDFLLWKAHAGGMDYVFKGDGTSNTQIENGKLISPKSKWDTGFRLGLGYLFPYDGWDVQFTWTRFHTKATSSQRVEGDQFLTPSFNALTTSVGFASPSILIVGANGIWKLMYNTLDAELGRATFFSRGLSLRPFLGVRGAWIAQDLNATYNSQAVTDAFAKVAAENNFRAVGLRGGIDLNYYFAKSWSIYGKASASLLFGTFHVNNIVRPNFSPATLPDSSLSQIRENLKRTRINFEGGGGIQWETYLDKNRYHLTLALGYEVVEWMHVNQMKEPFFNTTSPVPVFTGQYIPRRGNLDLQGGTLSARLDF